MCADRSREMTMKLIRNLAITVCAVITLTGCMTVYNKPIGASGGAQPLATPREHSTIVGLALSGGGDRASYLSAAILKEIHRQHVKVNSESPLSQGDLLTQIDYISSVSGGSLSAAYFGLHLDELESAADVDA